MTRFPMWAALCTAIVVGQSFAAFADEVPTFDFKKTCKTDVQDYDGTSDQASYTGCVTDEQNARATLVSEWAQYSSASKRECVGAQVDGSGPQSYVELLTCLQIAKEVKGQPEN
jgi:hypothetical protein